MEIQASVLVANENIKKANHLKQQDDVNYRKWRDCHWWDLCSASSEPPARIVPQGVADGAHALKDAILAWATELTTLTECSKNIDQICAKRMIADHIGMARLQFESVYTPWNHFKEGLCAHHDWHVCDSSSVLLGLDAIMSEPTR